jgi:hypothetical protein
MADNKEKNKKKYLETDKEREDAADTDNFPPPEFVAKPAPGDTGYAIVAAAYHDQTEYFRPGIRSVNHDIARERSGKEKPRRMYEHLYSFEEFVKLNESTGVITLEEILDWVQAKIIDKSVNVEQEIEKFAKQKSMKPEDLAPLAAHLLVSELGYTGKNVEDPDQQLLIDLVSKIDQIYGTETDIGSVD